MCKFHKDVARDIATDTNTGEFDPGKYSVALVAMAKFRIEQYMPVMHGCDGFIPSEMITEPARQAFKDAKLEKPFAEIEHYRDANIEKLRAAMTRTAALHNLTLQGLGIPDNITKSGYKHCDKMAADPTKNGPFLDEAVVDLFEGYDRPGYVSGELHLKKAAHKPAFSAIHAATARFLSQDGVVPILTQMFENSLAKVFQTAQGDYDAGRGFQKTDGCVMCHDTSSNPAAPAAQASAPPPKVGKLRKLTVTCGSCAGPAGGTVLGVLASHIPCVAIPVLASITGVALGGAFMTTSMLIVSPITAAAATIGIDKLTGRKFSKAKTAIAAALAFTVAVGVTQFTNIMPGMSMPDMDMGKPGMMMPPTKHDISGMNMSPADRQALIRMVAHPPICGPKPSGIRPS